MRDYGGRKEIYTFFITFCTSLSINWLVSHAYYIVIIFIFTQTFGFLFNPEFSLLFPVGFYTVSSEERSPGGIGEQPHVRGYSLLSVVYHDILALQT